MNQRQFRRGVAEFLVITLSILLAFALEAGWDRHGQRQDLEELLAAVRDEFVAGRSELDRAIGVQEEVRAGQAHWVSLMSPDPTPAEVNQLLALSSGMDRANSVVRRTTLDLPDGALRSLLAQGIWASIDDDELRVRLADWPSKVENALGSDRVLNEELGGLLALVSQGSYFPLLPLAEDLAGLADRFPTDGRRLLADPEIANRLAFTIRVADAAILEKERLRQDAAEIATLIEAYIAR